MIKKAVKHLHASDIRGIAQLATEATAELTGIVENLHQTVLSTIGIYENEVLKQTRGITGLIYKSVRNTALLVGNGIDTVLAKLQPLIESTEESQAVTPQREAVLAIINGIIGDRLFISNNPLAIPMVLRYQGKNLDWGNTSVIPNATSRVLLLIHGLCMNDLQWNAKHKKQIVNHGETLASALSYTPVYLRYNSGLHISQNGRELSLHLEKLVTHWPLAMEDLTIVAHSMGGLLARSAFHYAKQENLKWTKYLKNIVFLGTPHHGAPLERVGNWIDTVLGSTRYSAPFSKLGKLRSAGITDLRYGYILDEDWQGYDRFHRKPDNRQHVALPEGVACYSIAATLGGKRSVISDRLVGDGLVPLHSALGEHDNVDRKLVFAAQWIAYHINHMKMLSSPEVARQIIQWLTPVQA